MSVAVLLIGLFLLAVAVAVILRSLAEPEQQAPETIGQIGEYGYAATAPSAPRGARRLPSPRELAANVGEAVAARRPEREDTIRARLVAAGMYNRTPREFYMWQVVGAVGLGLLWLVIGKAAGFSTPIYVIGIALFTYTGWSVPSIVLQRRVKDRAHAIDRALPDLIDLLVVSVEAGIGFVGSLRMAADQLEGPLAQELKLTLQEQNMGLTTGEAMEGMLKRVDTPGMRAFVRAIVQGELLGVSIGQILRNLATEMRKRRKAMAEEQAQKAPVKMLFPLVLLIFPAMFVVLLVPALISIVDTLGG